MELTQSKKFNKNYAAKIVEVSSFDVHPNPKCERLKIAHVDGYSVAVSIDTQPGTYVYFPVECQISASYLYSNNLFRHAELNKDPEQTGFFEDNRRVRAIKLQKYPSEGLLMPLSSLYTWLKEVNPSDSSIIKVNIGSEFDSIDGEILCKKYVVKQTPRTTPGSRRLGKQPKGLDKLVENQFRFHYDTVLIKKTPWVIKPNSLISLTTKVHGTSGISSYVICKREVSKTNRVCQAITNFFLKLTGNKSEVVNTWQHYDYIYASRKVIKNKYFNENVTSGYYGVDVWGHADGIVKNYLQKGMTAYYEILGFLPDGGAIQSAGGNAFDYGCVPPKEGEAYTYGKHFKVFIYRLTYTNPDGEVHEFSAKEVQQWCKHVGLVPVHEEYYGYAKDLYPDIEHDDEFGQHFIDRLGVESMFHMEQASPDCINKVPHEGLVIKIEDSRSAAYKLKCFKFLEKETKELDNGRTNIEDNQEGEE